MRGRVYDLDPQHHMLLEGVRPSSPESARRPSIKDMRESRVRRNVQAEASLAVRLWFTALQELARSDLRAAVEAQARPYPDGRLPRVCDALHQEAGAAHSMRSFLPQVSSRGRAAPAPGRVKARSPEYGKKSLCVAELQDALHAPRFLPKVLLVGMQDASTPTGNASKKM